MLGYGIDGGLAEWSKAADLKSVKARAFRGSNPLSSAIFVDFKQEREEIIRNLFPLFYFCLFEKIISAGCQFD